MGVDGFAFADVVVADAIEVLALEVTSGVGQIDTLALEIMLDEVVYTCVFEGIETLTLVIGTVLVGGIIVVALYVLCGAFAVVV